MSRSALNPQHGGSLIEMLVASALGLMVLGGASPLMLQMLQQQTTAQQRLEQAEAVRFASQMISQHVRSATQIMPQSNSSVLEVLMPPTTESNWVNFGCIQSSANDRLQIIYSPTARSLSCKNASTNSSPQVLIDKLGPLRFDYQCIASQGSGHGSLASHTAATAAACNQGVVAVLTTLQVPHTNNLEVVSDIRWTTVARQVYWAHSTP